MDEAARRARNPQPAAYPTGEPAPSHADPSASARPELTPEEARWQAFWESFEAASLDDRLDIGRTALTGGEALDGEALVEIAGGLVEPLRVAGRWAESDALLDTMASAQPAAFAEEVQWFRFWRAESALLRPDADRATVRCALRPS